MAVPDVTARLGRAWRGVAGQSEPKTAVAPNDPIVAYFKSTAGPVEIGNVRLDSPALRAMVAAGLELVVPLARLAGRRLSPKR